MGRTQLGTKNLQDGGTCRDDLNTSMPGQAVVRKLLQGSGIILSANGVDAGTGDVTVKLSPDIDLGAQGGTQRFSYGDSAFQFVSTSGDYIGVEADFVSSGGDWTSLSLYINPEEGFTLSHGNAQILLHDSVGIQLLELGLVKYPKTMQVSGEGGALANAVALPFVEHGDMLRWKAPLTSEYWTGTAWSSYSTPTWKKLTDGKPDSSISLDYTHRKIRLTYDLVSPYHMSPLLILQQLYSNPVNQYKVTVEESANGSSWTARLSERWVFGVSGTSIMSMDDRGDLYQRYVRITFEWAGSSGNVFNLAGLQLITFRNGDQGGTGLHKLLPMTWDENRNLTFSGNLKVIGPDGYNGGGQQAILNLGDSNIAIRAEWGFGLHIDVAGMSDALIIEENTGNASFGGAIRAVDYQSANYNSGMNTTVSLYDRDGVCHNLGFENGLLTNYEIIK